MNKEIINPVGTPPAVGAYSPALKVGNMVFVSGQIPQGDNIPDDVASQTEMAIKNIQNLLEAANMTLDNVVMANVYLSDVNNFDKMNNVYMKYFKKPFPARVTVEAKIADPGTLVEISCIAICD